MGTVSFAEEPSYGFGGRSRRAERRTQEAEGSEQACGEQEACAETSGAEKEEEKEGT